MNNGRLIVDLKPRAERKRSVQQIVADLRPKLAQVPGVACIPLIQPPINLGGQQNARSLYQFTLQDTDTDELYRAAPAFEEKMRQMPGLARRQQRPARSRTRRFASTWTATRSRRSA